MAAQLVIQPTGPSHGGIGDSLLFHGTSFASAIALLANPHLDHATATAEKIDGPPGFFLAASPADAEFFALRRAPGAVLRYTLTGPAMAALIEAGAKVQAIPPGNPPYFGGPEMWIPPVAFAVFNAQVDGGAIRVGT